MKTSFLRLAVDRREGETVVLVGDDDRIFEVPASQLPKECRVEGAVLDVPLGDGDHPQWGKATRNRVEEAARLLEARERLDRLRQTDPGGDITL